MGRERVEARLGLMDAGLHVLRGQLGGLQAARRQFLVDLLVLPDLGEDHAGDHDRRADARHQQKHEQDAKAKAHDLPVSCVEDWSRQAGLQATGILPDRQAPR
ncbi:hypothetical protein D3C72_1704490 [compost metagenome]